MMTAESPTFESIAIGDKLPTLTIEMTATRIVAGAIATRDFMPVHHDRDYANKQGAPDIFMNILSDTGHCSRFLTDWAGPDAIVRKLSIRLGAPVFPDSTLTFDGEVSAMRVEDDEGIVDIEFRAINDLGDHVSGVGVIGFPRNGADT
jgi:acyl dehydratase